MKIQQRTLRNGWLLSVNGLTLVATKGSQRFSETFDNEVEVARAFRFLVAHPNDVKDLR